MRKWSHRGKSRLSSQDHPADQWQSWTRTRFSPLQALAFPAVRPIPQHFSLERKGVPLRTFTPLFSLLVGNVRRELLTLLKNIKNCGLRFSKKKLALRKEVGAAVSAALLLLPVKTRPSGALRRGVRFSVCVPGAGA